MDWTFLPGKTYAIIGARSGSKNVPQKNIYNIHGFPLLAYSIAAGILTPEIERVLVSTNSKQFKAVAEQFGGEVPFLRPDELATDTSTDRDFIVHTLETLQKQEGGIPEYLVFLRPTSPLRDPKKISEALAYFKEMPEATGLRSAHVTNIIPQKLFHLDGKFFKGLFPHDTRSEYHGLPRQSFPVSYKPDGYIDILKTKTILESKESMYGDSILAFLTPDTGDIDVISDVEYVHAVLESGDWDVYEYLRNNYASLQSAS